MAESSNGPPTDAWADQELPAHMVSLASSVNQLGVAVLGRDLSESQARELTAAIDQITATVETGRVVTKAESAARRNRIATFLETGQWPDPPPDGSRMVFDPASPIGGDLNPFSVGAQYFRDGDEAVGRVHASRCFEGPPDRLHGGVICAIFDEVMGSVFRATGTASAFTGELTVRFEAPCPIDAELEFRARLVSSEGRRRYLEAEATSPQGQFARATAIFVEMRPENFGD